MAEQKIIAEKVKADDAGKNILGSRGFVYYTVTPMSNIKRTALTYPDDGMFEGSLQVVAAQGEFEPASVVLFGDRNLNGMDVSVSDLKNKDGKRIPGTNVDVKLVKIWVQTGCGWYSYFSDSQGRTLVPELLVNDENFVKVDLESMNNFVRESLPDQRREYIMVSSPIEYAIPVHGHKENIMDAETFQPFTLAAREFKQLWFTVEVPADAPAGLYQGTIRVKAQNGGTAEIPLQVRVLPFQLPVPMTNYDLNRVFYTSSYNGNNLARYIRDNGGDVKRAELRLKNEYESYRKHNLMNPMVSYDHDLAAYLRNLEIFRDAGLDTSVIFDGTLAVPPYDYLVHSDRKKPLAEQGIPKGWEERVKVFTEVKKLLGEDTVLYCFGWDEPGMSWLKAERAPWKYFHEKGMKIYSTAHDAHLAYAGFNEDFVDYGGSYSSAAARKWHSFGARITSYANPHTGPENPDFVRRTHGMDLYLADQDGTNNYMASGDDWNDFGGADYNYRSFNWVYSAANGHIDTIQFEAFREAIDDVKYATLLRQYGNRAMASGNIDIVYKGKAALQWLIQVDSANCDLNTLRFEMINKILELKALLK